MLTKQHIFRPAWIRTVGPGLILAMLLSAAIVLSSNYEMISPSIALRLHLVPNLVLLGACARWLLQGSIVVKPNQVVLQGWTKVVDREGRKRYVQIRRSIPRSEWNSIAVKGLFFASVTWSDEGETIVLERLGRPDLLRKLLVVPAGPFDSLLSLKPLPLLLVALIQVLKLATVRAIAAIGRLCPQSSPYLNAAARWALRQARHAIRVLGVHLVTLTGGSRSTALEYARFVAFCRHYLMGRRLAVVKDERASFYWRILKEACVIYGYASSEWILHPRIQSLDDITERIPQRTFERMWFENLLQDVDIGNLGQGRFTVGNIAAGGGIADGSKHARIPVALHQAH
jgi:hypothetical protein